MQSVRLVVRSEVLEHILMGILSDVFKIREQLVCHLGIVMEGSLIESIPCKYPCGIIWNGGTCRSFDKSSRCSWFSTLRQAVLLRLIPFNDRRHVGNSGDDGENDSTKIDEFFILYFRKDLRGQWGRNKLS